MIIKTSIEVVRPRILRDILTTIFLVSKMIKLFMYAIASLYLVLVALVVIFLFKLVTG